MQRERRAAGWRNHTCIARSGSVRYVNISTGQREDLRRRQMRAFMTRAGSKLSSTVVTAIESELGRYLDETVLSSWTTIQTVTTAKAWRTTSFRRPSTRSTSRSWSSAISNHNIPHSALHASRALVAVDRATQVWSMWKLAPVQHGAGRIKSKPPGQPTCWNGDTCSCLVRCHYPRAPRYLSIR